MEKATERFEANALATEKAHAAAAHNQRIDDAISETLIRLEIEANEHERFARGQVEVGIWAALEAVEKIG